MPIRYTLHKLQEVCLFLVILFMPIFSMPKAYTLPVLGGRLSFYALAVGLVLWVIEGVFYRDEWKLDKRIKIFFLVVIGYKILGLLYGLVVFPYYEQVNAAQLLESSRGFRILHQLTSGQISVVIYLIMKSIKQTVAEMCTTIIPALWVYSLYRKQDFSVGYRFFQKCFVVLCVALCLYAIPEILLFKLHLPIGEAILNVTNPYLYDVKAYMDWYPPVIWPNQQVRSLCTEPSVLGFTGAAILPFLWDLVSPKNWKAALLYVFYFMILVMSKARTTWVVLIFELSSLFSLALWNKKLKSAACLLLLCVIGFSLGSCGYTESRQSYIKENVFSIADANARSNGSRWINIKSHLTVVLAHPVLGTGVGLKDLYVKDSLIDGALKNGEIRQITEGIEREGLLKYSYGNVNEFVFVLTNEGIAGLILYLFPFFYVLYQCFRKKYLRMRMVQVCLVAVGGALASGVAGEPITALYLILGLLCTKCIGNDESGGTESNV